MVGGTCHSSNLILGSNYRSQSFLYGLVICWQGSRFALQQNLWAILLIQNYEGGSKMR